MNASPNTAHPPVPAPAPTSASAPARTPPLPLLGRGLVAGGLAGLVTGLFSLLLAEPLMDRAIRAEEARQAHEEHAGAAGGAVTAHHEELFTRGTQHFGLVVTAVVAGLALGVLFAVVHLLVHRRTDPGARPWSRALTLAAAAFTGVALLPGLRYPANPPGVGDAGTVGERQLLWLAAVVIGALGMVLAWQVHRRLAGRPDPVRHSAVALIVIAFLALLFTLPGNPDPVPVPATLLWDFRMLSLASHALLWSVLGAAFGILGLRAAARSSPARTRTRTAADPGAGP
ncbi:CbtA family protein [Streptomyces sp. MST-110588]|uniref:CbtA family protein n=1 Tax=Streptomyces sp. MST-110588 TaxID=2833628 RepID=UPI001F5C670A|nr:CbtA family protein [Streptomyces sp. MST-110588]UNO41852.1 CbtA family protein [Streptomyces sp. MST-110588]